MFEKIRNLYTKDWEYIENISAYKKLNNKNILITGATGLIGTGLVDFLVYINKKFGFNINIIALGRNIDKLNSRFLDYINKGDIKIINQDVCDKLDINLNLDYIIHAASNADPSSFVLDCVGTMKANIEGTINLLEYCNQRKSCKLLFVSTSEVYGNVEESIVSEENFGTIDCNTLRACYPESKRMAETLCHGYASQHDLDIKIARLCYVYGPTMTDSDSRVVAQFIRNAINNENIVMKSEGTQERSYCYITDAVDALIHILILGKTKNAYNIANNKSNTSIRNIANVLSKQNNINVVFKNPNIKENKGYSTQGNIILDYSKLRLLGWTPKITLEEGLKKTVDILKEIHVV